MFKFELGDKVKETNTPFAGTVRARTEYAHGTNSYLIESISSSFTNVWITEDKLIKS